MCGAMFAWRMIEGDGWQISIAATVLLAALPGILGPAAVIPVGVDLPATAGTLLAVMVMSSGHPAHIVAGCVVLAWVACVRETAPVWAAVWLWSPWPLIVLVVPVIRHVTTRTGPDPLGPKFDEIAAHPVRSALAAHRGRWRDGWVMVAPWGVCLAGLYRPSLWVVVAVVVAYGQLLVATDTVRLVQHAAGPVLAVAAARTVPVEWLVLAVVVHVVWFVTPERV